MSCKPFKAYQGNNFSRLYTCEILEISQGTSLDLSDWIITSELRNADTKALIQNLIVTHVGKINMSYQIIVEATPAQTENWNAGLAVMDIKFRSPDGLTIRNSEPEYINIIEPITD